MKKENMFSLLNIFHVLNGYVPNCQKNFVKKIINIKHIHGNY